jgi:hypothetical protein
MLNNDNQLAINKYTITENQITVKVNIWDLNFTITKSGNTNRYHLTCLYRFPPSTHICLYSYHLPVVLGLYPHNSLVHNQTLQFDYLIYDDVIQ